MSGKAFVTYGLGFGDETKGATVDWLCRRFGAAMVVRYSGGPQAAHHVVRPNGDWHCFAQFGSGSLAGVPTWLAPTMLIELECLVKEAERLDEYGDPWAGITLDRQSGLVTPMNKMINQLTEIALGREALGSCGMGVGDSYRNLQIGNQPRLADLLDGQALPMMENLLIRARRTADQLRTTGDSPEFRETESYFLERCSPASLERHYRQLLDEHQVRVANRDLRQTVARRLDRDQNVVFEGAQGALIDPCFGYRPYVTKTPCTSHAARPYLPENAEITRIGVMRAYLTRHGAGPFPTEDSTLTSRLSDRFNRHNRWQGTMRCGWLDLPLLRLALRVNPRTDWLAVSCLDQLSGLPELRICLAHDAVGNPGRWLLLRGWRKPLGDCRRLTDLPRNCRRFLDFLASPSGLDTPIGLIAVGPTAENRLYLL